VKWQSISGYLISRWTGTKYLSMSLSEASWTGLLDFRNACWDVQLLDLVHMDVKKMPQIEVMNNIQVILKRRLLFKL
jgi:sugar (pentulose or hexulose) kinase